MTAAVVVLAAAAWACSGDRADTPPQAARRAAADGASVVLITLDTTRADHLGPYGADGATPTLSALAGDGIVFDRAVATAPVTAPAHASLLTGLYPVRHGVHDNSIHHLPDDIVTLAERLAADGARTAAFVSTVILDHRYGLDQGFALYNDDIRGATTRTDRRMTVERPADATTDRALAWLDGLDDRSRFFLWVHYYDPHIPYSPPAPWAGRFPDRPYDGEIAFMDAEIGRLLAHPRLAVDRTLVVAVGDHGEGLGEHGERTHGLLVYDSTLRVPLIVRIPGGPAGRRVAAPVSQVDVVPTVVELLGLEPDPDVGDLDGVSLVPLIRGVEPATDRPVFSESQVPFFAYGWAKLRAVRRGGLKLIDAPTPELYDLDHDPGELDNLAPARPADAGRLDAEIAAWATGAERPGSTVAVDAETSGALRALGYVAGEVGRPDGAGHGNPVELMPVHDQLQVVGELLSTGRAEEAVRRARAALALDPDNLAALRDLSRGLVLLGHLDEAAGVAARASAVAPWSARALAVEADVEFRRGHADHAVALADRALALDPRFLEARIDRSRYLAAVGRTDEVRAELESLLADAPDDNWVELRYAELVELAAGNVAAAEGRLRRVLERNPGFTEAALLLGNVLTDTGRSDEAVAVYREAIAAGAAGPDLPARLALLTASLNLQRGDWSGAENLAREAVGLDPSSAAAWNTLAIALDEMDRLDEAEAAYRRAAELDPGGWRAPFNLGILLRERGRYSEAASVQEEVLRRSPNNPGAHFELGVLWAGFLGDTERGKHHLQAAIAADPNTPRAAQARRMLDRLP